MKRVYPVLTLVVALALLGAAIFIVNRSHAKEVNSRQLQQTKQQSPVNRKPATPASPVMTRRVYLTFDDGPNNETTPQILDILKKYRINATFMVIGRGAKAHQSVLQRIIREGNAIGNHTYSHDYSLYHNPARFKTDVEMGALAIREATGITPTLFRPPGGVTGLTAPCRQILRQEGYRIIGWNVTSADSDPHGVVAAQLIHNVVTGVAKLPKGEDAIVLMHDGVETGGANPTPGSPGYRYLQSRKADVEALPVIIEQLEAQGCGFDKL